MEIRILLNSNKIIYLRKLSSCAVSHYIFSPSLSDLEFSTTPTFTVTEDGELAVTWALNTDCSFATSRVTIQYATDNAVAYDVEATSPHTVPDTVFQECTDYTASVEVDFRGTANVLTETSGTIRPNAPGKIILKVKK